MDRRSFLKIIASIGASIALPVDLATASQAEVDAAWTEAADRWHLFEVGEYNTLSYANFLEPTTRYDAYGFYSRSDVPEWMLENFHDLYDPIQDLYREHLHATRPRLGEAAIEARVEADWLTWCRRAKGKDREQIDQVIDNWLSDAPDEDREWEYYYKTGNAQGAAYGYFQYEDPDLMDELGIVVIEGDHPGSTYYAAELHIAVEDANSIAAKNGWPIRFVNEGESIVRYEREEDV